jgi:hypothetical protein
MVPPNTSINYTYMIYFAISRGKGRKMPTAKQLTVWVENRPGMLGEVGSALGAKKVNIKAYMAAVTDGRGTIRMVVDKRAAAKRVFAEHGWETTEEDVLMVALSDQPGSLGKVAHKLREASVNIDYAYAGLGPTARRVNAYFGVSDLKVALIAAR